LIALELRHPIGLEKHWFDHREPQHVDSGAQIQTDYVIEQVDKRWSVLIAHRSDSANERQVALLAQTPQIIGATRYGHRFCLATLGSMARQ
jgi:hypothetical protein